MSEFKMIKRILATLICVLFTFSGTASAAVIYLHTNLSVDNAIDGVNDNFQTISDWANGDVEGAGIQGTTVNLKAASIGVADMAAEANPATRDNELLGVSTTNNGFVSSGCEPATATGLTSDISACVAYVDGYRVSNAATSKTYTASRDTYVDVDKNGTYTLVAVSNGAAEPSTTANSIRLSKVVTDGTDITTVTDQANRTIPNLVTPTNYRDGLRVSRESATTISIFPGYAEMNGSIVSKTSKTTLTVAGVSGDWASGTDDSTPDEVIYVGMDSSGNLKLDDSRATHQNYAVSVTDGKFRYATWNSTVYRVLGWAWLNGSEQLGSGLSTDSAVSNLRDGDLPNRMFKVGTTDITSPGATPALMQAMDITFDSSGGIVNALFTAPMTDDNGVGTLTLKFNGETITETRVQDVGGNGVQSYSMSGSAFLTPGANTVRVFWRDDGNAIDQKGDTQGSRWLHVWED